MAAEKGAEAVVLPERVAEAWELATPMRDRLDPEKLQKLLVAIPDLWVEDFIANSDQLLALADLLTVPSPGAALQFAVGAKLLDSAGTEQAFLKRTGLDKPERTLTVSRNGGDPVIVQFGGVAKMARATRPSWHRP